MVGPIVERFQKLYDHFIPVSTTCYDDPTKDYSGRVASKVVLDNQTHVNETSLKFCDELRPNLILKTGGTGINSDDITPETNTPLVEDQCVVINIGTELPDTRRKKILMIYKETAALEGRCCHQPAQFRHRNLSDQ
ncbi:unnamed protein product [Rotaria socialis]